MLLWLLVILCIPSVTFAQWTNEPSGSVPVVDCTMSTVPSSCSIVDVYNSGINDTDGTAPVSPSGVLRGTIQAFAPTGGMQLVFSQNPTREMFVGMEWRTNPQFQGRIVANKLFFIRANQLGNGYVGMEGPRFSPTMNLMWGHNTSGLDNSHVCEADSGLICRPNTGNGQVTIGAWTKIEVYQKASTTAISRDGIFRLWINGTKHFEYTNLNYAPSGLSEWQWNNTWDGAQDMGTSNTVAWSHYLDHVYISIPNCPLGCTGGTNPPPQPTPQPLPPTSGNYVYQSQYSGTQGSSQWSYRDTAGNLLTYNSGSNLWLGIQSYQGTWSSGFHPGTTNGTVIRWTAPENGTATISGSAQKGDLACGDGVTFEVKKGASVLYTKALTYNDPTAYPYSVSQAMTTGQTIDFIVTPGATQSCDSTMLNPTIGWDPTSVLVPTIASFLPTSGSPGTSVVITGTNFIPSLQGNQVSFSNIAATVTAATSTSITATVPPHALTGTVKVTTVEGTGTSGGSFTVPPSGVVEDVGDLTASALSTTSVTAHFTALSDGAGAAAKHDVRMAAGTISWGSASSVASGTCATPYAPGVINTAVTCTITGLTTGTQYDIQLVPYKGTLGVDAVYGNISNIATVTPMGTVLDVPIICELEEAQLLARDFCQVPDQQVSFLHD